MEILSFSEFLTESKEKSNAQVSLAGTSSERFMHDTINNYAKHRENGLSHSNAIKRSVTTVFDPEQRSTQKVTPNLKNKLENHIKSNHISSDRQITHTEHLNISGDHHIEMESTKVTKNGTPIGAPLKHLFKANDNGTAEPVDHSWAHTTSSKLGRGEFFRIQKDSKQAAAKVIHHVRKTYGDILGSTHTGQGQEAAVKDLTGQKSNADLILHVKSKSGEQKQVKFLGSSNKYSSADKPSNTIKLHSPTPKNFAAIVDRHHEAMFGHKYGLANHYDKALEERTAEEKNIYAKHHDYLSGLYGENEQRIRHKKGKVQFVGYDKKTGLNANGMSHQRKLSKQGSAPAKAFLEDMASANIRAKAKIADHSYKAIKRVMHGIDEQHITNHATGISHNIETPMEHMPGKTELAKTRIKNNLYRSLTNIPGGRNTSNVPTLLVNTARQNDENGKFKSPKVDIYNPVKTVDKYLAKTNATGSPVGPKTTHMFKVNDDGSATKVDHRDYKDQKRTVNKIDAGKRKQLEDHISSDHIPDEHKLVKVRHVNIGGEHHIETESQVSSVKTPHTMNYNRGTTNFTMGPVSISADIRAGTTAGSINVTHIKDPHMHKEGSY